MYGELDLSNTWIRGFQHLCSKVLNIEVNKKELFQLRYGNWNLDLNADKISYAAGDA